MLENNLQIAAYNRRSLYMVISVLVNLIIKACSPLNYSAKIYLCVYALSLLWQQ